jgi:serine O-acetyltransferase
MTDENSTQGLFALLREDYRAHEPRAWASPGFHALAVHRFGARTRDVRGWYRKPVRGVYVALWRLVASIYGIELSHSMHVGRRLVIGHQGGIVLGPASIGDDCLVRQNVTIGVKVPRGERPVIGDRVHFGEGAVIIGGVTVGDDVTIGPNAVVMESVPSGSRVLAPKPKIITPDDRG